ncbi:hypothetical protein NKH18_41190 [Streptomyces sp. M10(2022)]
MLWWGDGSAGFAATELRDYVRRITGARLPLRAVPRPAGVPEGITGLVALRAGTGGAVAIPAGRIDDAGENSRTHPRTPSPCWATTPASC